MDVIDRSRESAAVEGRTEQSMGRMLSGTGQSPSTAETSGLYRFRKRHPWLYGMIAFILGGGLAAVFVMAKYQNWTYEGINLKAALYELVFGGLGAGIGAVILAFVLAGVLKDSLPAMKSAGS